MANFHLCVNCWSRDGGGTILIPVNDYDVGLLIAKTLCLELKCLKVDLITKDNRVLFTFNSAEI